MSLHPWRNAFENPDFPTLVDGNNKAKQQQQKLSPNEPGGRAARLGERFFRFTLLLLRQRYVFVYVVSGLGLNTSQHSSQQAAQRSPDRSLRNECLTISKQTK